MGSERTMRHSLSATGRKVLTRYARSDDGTLTIQPGTAATRLSLFRKGFLVQFGEYDQWQITPSGREEISDGQS